MNSPLQSSSAICTYSRFSLTNAYCIFQIGAEEPRQHCRNNEHERWQIHSGTRRSQLETIREHGRLKMTSELLRSKKAARCPLVLTKHLSSSFRHTSWKKKQSMRSKAMRHCSVRTVSSRLQLRVTLQATHMAVTVLGTQTLKREAPVNAHSGCFGMHY